MKKMKFKSAEEKRRWEENEQTWKSLKAKYEPSKKIQPEVDKKWSYTLKTPEGRESPNIRSINTPGGSTGRRSNNVYTGDKIKGIGMMHKSNLVPVFSDEEAVEISKMRRG